MQHDLSHTAVYWLRTWFIHSFSQETIILLLDLADAISRVINYSYPYNFTYSACSYILDLSWTHDPQCLVTVWNTSCCKALTPGNLTTPHILTQWSLFPSTEKEHLLLYEPARTLRAVEGGLFHMVPVLQYMVGCYTGEDLLDGDALSLEPSPEKVLPYRPLPYITGLL